MSDEPKVKVYGHGLPDEITPGGPPGEASATAVITHLGHKVFVRFAPGDLAGEGEVWELRVRGERKNGRVDAKALRRLTNNAELYIALARKTMQLLAGEYGSTDDRWQAYAGATKAIREVGGPGRGFDDSFYEMIGTQYRALIEEGNPHPVKTIGERNHITISGASRWIKEARRRGYIEEGVD